MSKRTLVVGAISAIALTLVLVPGGFRSQADLNSPRVATLTTQEDKPASGNHYRPPAATDVPAISAEQATQVFREFGLRSGLLNSAATHAVIQLTRYTSDQQAAVQSDGSTRQLFKDVLAWRLLFTDVPGIMHRPLQLSNAELPDTSHCSFDFLVDANTGEYMTASQTC